MTDPVGTPPASGGTPPAGTPPAGTPPAGTPPAGTPPAAPAIAWLQGAQDTDVGYVQNKGWTTPLDAVTGYRQLETVFGADRAGRTIVMPKDGADTTTADAMWTKLGWNADVAAYKLPVPDGEDAKFSQDMAALFHKHRVPVGAAQGFAADFNAYVAKTIGDRDAADKVKADGEMTALRGDWGNQFDARMEWSKRYAAELGFTEDQVGALQKVAGAAGVFRAFAKGFEEGMAHDPTKGMGNAPGSFATTPEGAKAKRQQLMADKDFGAKARNKNSAEWAELQRLDRIITGQVA